MYYIFMYYYILYFLSFSEILRLLFFFLCLRNNFKKFFMYDKLKNYYFIKDMYCKDINLKQRNLN